MVRSAIARSLVSAGFHPTLGIHHDSQLNAFNLADDLIEAYRAIVDLMCESLKRIILDKSDESLKLPIILPIESMEGITE